MYTEVCKINLSRKTYIKNWYYEFMMLYTYSYYVHGYFVQLTEKYENKLLFHNIIISIHNYYVYVLQWKWNNKLIVKLKINFTKT